MTLADLTIDFLELVGGIAAQLVDAPLVSGHYSKLRIAVADTNESVIGGQSEPLIVSSGAQTGVRINLDFDITDDEMFEIYLDLDVPKSVKKAGNRYLMTPTFKVTKKVFSRTIAGTVVDTAGVGLGNAVINAVADGDSSATLTGDDVAYKIVVLAGNYDLPVEADGFSAADTSYTAVAVEAEAALTEYDFAVE